MQLSMCNYQELFLRRESPTEISLWLGPRPASVHTAVTGSDFTSFDTYHKRSGFVIRKSYQTLLTLERVSDDVITVYNYLCTEKPSTTRKHLMQAKPGKVTDR